MSQHISQVTVTVRDYDEALAFYVDKLGFEKLEDTALGGGKRWVRVRPSGSAACILLAKATDERQRASVGNQTGGRVFVFLETDDFWRDYNALVARDVSFVRPPTVEPYGTVAVFEDLYGNKFDLIGRKNDARTHPDVEELVKRLGLAPHPEGGFYRETWRSPRTVGEPNVRGRPGPRHVGAGGRGEEPSIRAKGEGERPAAAAGARQAGDRRDLVTLKSGTFDDHGKRHPDG